MVNMLYMADVCVTAFVGNWLISVQSGDVKTGFGEIWGSSDAGKSDRWRPPGDKKCVKNPKSLGGDEQFNKD